VVENSSVERDHNYDQSLQTKRK